MFTILRSAEFDVWLVELADERAKARIAARIVSAELGNLGDYKPIDAGVLEMRIDFGPGYRVYFMRRGKFVYLLLLGGEKKNQKRDIERAKKMAQTIGRAGK